MDKLLRIALFLCFLFLQGSGLYAQLLDWAKSPTGVYQSYDTKIGMDNQGNTFVAGKISGRAAFGTTILKTVESTTYTSFLAKYNAQGSCQWAKLLDTTVYVGTIATDAAGNFYISGNIWEAAATFGSTTLTPPLHQSINFLAKYDTQGSCLWAVKITEGTNGGYMTPNNMAISKEGNIALTGVFTGTHTTASKPDLVAKLGETTTDMFVILCNSSGNVLWARQTRGEGEDKGKDVAFDATGNVYVTGSISENEYDYETTGHQTSFDTFTLKAKKQDMFLAKYDLSGKCLWVQQAGSIRGTGGQLEEGAGIVIDNEGNSYITGTTNGKSMFGSIDTAPARTDTAYTSTPFVAKYSPAGSCEWAKTYRCGYGTSHDIALKGNSLYITGSFMNHIFFEGERLYSAKENKAWGAHDVFVAKLFTDGAYHWAVRTGGTGFDEGSDIEIGPENKLYVVGLTDYGTFNNTTLQGPLVLLRFSDDANMISGRVFKDLNNNGLFDSGELPAAKTVVEVLPGPIYTLTNEAGFYRTFVREGEYTVSVSQPPLYHSITTTHNATFSQMGSVDENNDFALKGQVDIVDGYVQLYGNDRVRPGFKTSQTLTYGNSGTIAQNGTIELVLDATYEYLGSTPAASVNGNKLTWSYTNLQPDEKRTVSIQLKLPATIALGTGLSSTSSLTCEGTDVELGSNTHNVSQLVVGSYDPNDKAVSDTIISPAQLAASQPLIYTIRFQNKGTAEALFVTVKDSLSEKLDIGSFRMLEASHPYSVKMNEKGVLEWFFDNINLPAEMHNEPASHGFIRYSIVPKAALSIGEVIENKAYIYFDYNAPIVTNSSITRISKHAQAISFASVEDKTFGEAPFSLSASSSSSQGVTFSVVSGPATLTNQTLTLTGSGEVTIRARVEADNNFASGEIEQTFMVHKAAQSITFPAIEDKHMGIAPLELQAKASSLLPIIYHVVSGPATLKDNVLTITNMGQVILKATQAGDNNYLSAEEVTVSFCVLPSKPVITANGSVLTSSANEGNEWYKDGLAITGARARNYNATEAGEYMVKVTGPCGEAQASEIFKVTVAGTNEEITASIKLYPNPALTEVTLALPWALSAKRITLLTTTGTVIKDIELFAINSEYTISTKDLAKGIYLIKVETSHGNILKKLVKK